MVVRCVGGDGRGEGEGDGEGKTLTEREGVVGWQEVERKREGNEGEVGRRGGCEVGKGSGMRRD